MQDDVLVLTVLGIQWLVQWTESGPRCVISLDDLPVGGFDPWLLLLDGLPVALSVVLDFLTWSAPDGIDGTNCSGNVDEICSDDSLDSMHSRFMLISLFVGMIMELLAKC